MGGQDGYLTRTNVVKHCEEKEGGEAILHAVHVRGQRRAGKELKMRNLHAHSGSRPSASSSSSTPPHSFPASLLQEIHRSLASFSCPCIDPDGESFAETDEDPQTAQQRKVQEHQLGDESGISYHKIKCSMSGTSPLWLPISPCHPTCRPACTRSCTVNEACDTRACHNLNPS